MSKQILTGYDVKTATISADKINLDTSFDRSPYTPTAAKTRGYEIRDGRTKEFISDFDHVAGNSGKGALFYDGKYLWTGGITDSGTQYLTQIDPTNFPSGVTYCALGANQYVSGITFDGTYIWVNAKNNLFKINRDANTIAQTIVDSGHFSSPSTGGIIYDQAGHLYFARNSLKIYRYDIGGNSFTNYTLSYGTDCSFCLDGTFVYMLGTSATLFRINVNTLSQDSLAVSYNNGQIMFDGALLWMVAAGHALVIDPTSFTILTTITNTDLVKYGVFDGSYIVVPKRKIDIRTWAVSSQQLSSTVGDGFGYMEYDGTYNYLLVITSGTVGRVRRFLA